MGKASTRSRLAVLLLGSLASTGAGLAQSSASRASCERSFGAKSVDACTALIQSGRETPRNLAYDYKNRAQAYSYSEDLDRAEADFTQAIRLLPDYEDAFAGRARLYEQRRDYDRAIVDFGEAIRLGGDHGKGYYLDRARVYRAKGDFGRALADCNEVVRLNDLRPGDNASFLAWLALEQSADLHRDIGEVDQAIDDYGKAINRAPKEGRLYFKRGIVGLYRGPVSNAAADLTRAGELLAPDGGERFLYAVLWHEIANSKSKQPSDLIASLAAGREHVDVRRWPAPVVRLYLGQWPLQPVLASADNSAPNTKNQRTCDVLFYGSEFLLKNGVEEEAVRLLTLASQTCDRSSAEGFAANAELKAFGRIP